jgi:hypothetical protein
MKEGTKFEVTKCCGATPTFYINANTGKARQLKMCTACKKPADVEKVIIVREKTINVLNKFLSKKSNQRKIPDMIVAEFITKSLIKEKKNDEGNI